MNYDQQATLFKALAHPARLQILDMLRRGEMCVCHFKAALKKRQAYISQQLMLLREVGLVESRKHGIQTYYRLIDQHVAEILDAVLGPLEDHPHEVVEECMCPMCIIARHEQQQGEDVVL